MREIYYLFNNVCGWDTINRHCVKFLVLKPKHCFKVQVFTRCVDELTTTFLISAEIITLARQEY